MKSNEILNYKYFLESINLSIKFRANKLKFQNKFEGELTTKEPD